MAPLVSHKGSAVQQALVKRGGEGWSEERVPTAAAGLCVHSPPPTQAHTFLAHPGAGRRPGRPPYGD